MKRLPAILLLLIIGACKKDDSASTNNPNSTSGDTTNNFSRLYTKMYNVQSIDTSSAQSIVIKTSNVPDHKSPFFGIGNAKYEAYNGDNPSFSTSINLNGTISNPTILTQNITFTLPRNPVPAVTHAATTGGPIGIARNGVVYFNQYNGMGAALDDLEINNADQYNGHPTPAMGNGGRSYHYHYEPKWLTASYGNSSFVGFLLDGFPVYGPYESGKLITTADLDAYNGHYSSTEDFPTQKIYHYHTLHAASSKPADMKAAAPYINGGMYYGNKGTVN
jgi:hypothetical protein